MSRDLVGFLRGVEKIGHAVTATQRSKWQHAWRQSSLKSAAGQMVNKMEDQVSEAITRPDEFQNSVQNKVGMMASQISILIDTVRSQSQIPQSEKPYPFEIDPEVLNENEMFGFDESATSQLEEEMASQGLKLGDTTVKVQSAFKETDMKSSVHDSVDSTSQPLKKIIEDIHATADRPSQPVQKTVEEIIHSSEGSKSSTIDATHHMTGSSSTAEHIVSPPLSPPTPEPQVTTTTQKTSTRKPLAKAPEQKLRSSARERKVPANMVSRLSSYGGLAVGLLAGTIGEVSKRKLGLSKPEESSSTASLFINEANAERVVNTLCRARGAALKLGQMISVQDSAVVPPEIQKIFDRVRQGADIMPTVQMKKAVTKNLGQDWQDLVDLEEKPFASASIGQVHRGLMKDGRKVAMKVQFPGVAQCIDSDIRSLMGVLNMFNIIPKGVYIDSVIAVARTELKWEVDYLREARCARRFRELVKNEPQFLVPEVIDKLSTGEVITSEYMEGIPLDQGEDLPQEVRDKIGSDILKLCLKELYVYRFMQTDPNWSNFMYQPDTGKIVLLDFGASREFDKKFVDGYIKIIRAAADQDLEGILKHSVEVGFLTGHESKSMEEAHVSAVQILGEALASYEPFDFGAQDMTKRITEIIPVMADQRLCPPPVETYSLHRKMSGAFLLCVKLRSRVQCKELFEQIWKDYQFGDLETEV